MCRRVLHIIREEAAGDGGKAGNAASDAMDASGEGAWQPQQVRPRKVSAALKVYAKMVTSADTGAVRDLSLLD